MAKEHVLIELDATEPEAFAAFTVASESGFESIDQAERMLEPLAGLDVDIDGSLPPVPMFSPPEGPASSTLNSLSAFASPQTNPDMASTTTVVCAQVERRALDELAARPGVTVWPDSRLTLYGRPGSDPSEDGSSVFDVANSQPGVDCRPFRPAVTISTIRALLGTDAVWRDGFRGQNVIVGILDEGVDGTVYPVVGACHA